MKKPTPPKKPESYYGKYLLNNIGKKLKSFRNKPLRSVRGYVGKYHWKQHTPQKYIKNYWKNFTQPIRRPYLQAKRVQKKVKRVVGLFQKAVSLHKKQVVANEKFKKKLERYTQQLSKYNKWRDNKFKKLNSYDNVIDKGFKKAYRDNKRQTEKDRKSWKELVDKYREGKASPPKGVPLDLANEWKLEKQREMFLKWNKEQLNYIPRMDENGYLAILISPEAIEKYYTDDAKSIFKTVEEFRDFLKDYFGFGGSVAFGTTSRVFDKDGNVTGIIKYFRILLKLVAKFML